MWASDHRWWKHHIGDITRDYDGQCWTIETAWPPKESPDAWGIKSLIADTNAGGLSRDKNKIHTGKNSGFAAIGLAYHLAATRILLLGFDMMKDGSQRHWFGAHPPGMEVDSSYASFIAQFRTINPAEYGIEIWNVSRRTAMEHFPIHSLDDL